MRVFFLATHRAMIRSTMLNDYIVESTLALMSTTLSANRHMFAADRQRQSYTEIDRNREGENGGVQARAHLPKRSSSISLMKMLNKKK